MFRLTTWILLLLFSSAVISQEVDESSISTESAAISSEEATTEAPSDEAAIAIETEPAAGASSEEAAEAPSEGAAPEEAAASSEEAAPEEAAASSEESVEGAAPEGSSEAEASSEAAPTEEASAEAPATEASTEETATAEEATSAEAPVTEETSAEVSSEEASAEPTEAATEEAPVADETASAEAPAQEESSAEEPQVEGGATAEESVAAEEAPASGEASEEVATAEQVPESEAASSEEAPAEEATAASEESGEEKGSEESGEVDVDSPDSGEVVDKTPDSGEVEAEKSSEEEEGGGGSTEEGTEEETEETEEASSEDAVEGEVDEPELDVAEEVEPPPAHLRPREHVDRHLGVDESSTEMNEVVQIVARTTLKELKRVYDSSVKPLEAVYKYKDISTRHLGDPELYSKSMILIMGPWGSGKSTFVNYLLGNEYTPKALKTGEQPGRGFFNIIEYGESDAALDGTELVAQWEFSSLQKFGQAFLQRLQGHRMPNRLLEKVTLVDMPGIVERGKQSERDYPFNDVCQWFIDRSDLILVLFDPTRLDAGLEMEALFDQLKGREPQVRIVLNKADIVRPQDLMRVQGNLFWALSPLLGSSEPPVIYAGSFWSRLYRPGAPIRLFRAQEEALLLDIRDAFESRVENRIALTRRHAVRVRNHAKMVDCYLNTFYSQKSFFGNKKKVAGEIVENPGDYRIYEGISTLTNISRYDLPDPDIYRDFFRLHPLYDFPTLHSTCTYFRGCPLDKLDIAISYDLPELLGKHRKSLEQAIVKVLAKRGQ